jgi:predicted AlkP superfamily phosphohydrolase/phosphomutase
MNPTLLLGLDGATFTILDPLMANGTMPFLNEFINNGVRAELRSTVNPLTPPAWISMITGRSPGNHGVFDFIWAEERKKDYYFTLYNFRDIQCETIWSMVSRQGGRACSLNFPMMSPPPEISGYVLPGLVSWKHLRRNMHPSACYDELKTIPGFNPKELAWDFDLEKKASKGVPEAEFESWIEFHIRREAQWFEVMHYLMKKDPSELTAIIFDGPDKILHIGWRFLDLNYFPKQPSSWEQKIRDLCLKYFHVLDGFLAELTAAAGPQARTFLTSDHGFGPSHFVLRINSWLHSQGYLQWRNIDNLEEAAQRGAKRLVEQHFVLLDWNKTTAYARTVTSNGIYIRVAREPGQTGVPADQYERFRNDLIEKLNAIEDPLSGERIIKRVLTREEAYPGRFNDLAPDLTLVMQDYGFVSILNKEPIIAHRPEVEGTHYPEGIFMGRGPGIQRGSVLPQFSILDIAPCLLYSLGLKIPSDFEGALPDGIFDKSFIDDHPVQVGSPTRAPDTYAVPAHKDSGKEEEQIYERLKSLGYIE